MHTEAPEPTIMSTSPENTGIIPENPTVSVGSTLIVPKVSDTYQGIVQSEYVIGEQIIYNENDIKITLIDVNYDKTKGLSITGQIENNSSNDINLTGGEIQINSCNLINLAYVTAEANTSKDFEIMVDNFWLSLYNITDINTLWGYLELRDSDEYTTATYIEFFIKISEDSTPVNVPGEILYSKDGITLSTLYWGLDPSSEEKDIYLLASNTTDKSYCITGDIKASVFGDIYGDIYPHSWNLVQVYLYNANSSESTIRLEPLNKGEDSETADLGTYTFEYGE